MHSVKILDKKCWSSYHQDEGEAEGEGGIEGGAEDEVDVIFVIKNVDQIFFFSLNESGFCRDLFLKFKNFIFQQKS